MPLNSKNGTIGALIVKSLPGGERYTEQDKELLQYVCAQVATAIERQQLYARLKRMAQYDQLTQLPNRGLLKDRLKAALAGARDASGSMALLYVDLDRFKQVNDTFGHAVGDMLLQTVASRLKGCVRDTDTVARIGGDEFVVLLHSIHAAEDADSVAEKSARCSCNPCVWTVTTCISSQASAWPVIPNMAARSSNCSGMPTRRCTPPNASIIGWLISEPVRAVRRGAGNFSKPLAARQFSI